jgi:hypothetical protein
LHALASLRAQAKQSAERRTRTYISVKGYLTRAATAMPEEDDSFKPAPDIRTFGELLGHTADHQMSLLQYGLRSAQAGRRLLKDDRGRLILDVVHRKEEYGYVAIYFRLKGIVPPSSDRARGRWGDGILCPTILV